MIRLSIRLTSVLRSSSNPAMFLIPEEWKSKRQRIIEAFMRTGSMSEAAQEVYGKRDVSYVRRIVIIWRRKVRDAELSTTGYKQEGQPQTDAA